MFCSVNRSFLFLRVPTRLCGRTTHRHPPPATPTPDPNRPCVVSVDVKPQHSFQHEQAYSYIQSDSTKTHRCIHTTKTHKCIHSTKTHECIFSAKTHICIHSTKTHECIHSTKTQMYTQYKDTHMLHSTKTHGCIHRCN